MIQTLYILTIELSVMITPFDYDLLFDRPPATWYIHPADASSDRRRIWA
jgi:hypothetical protein